MVVRARATTGKRKAVTYEEQDWDDDVQMNDASPPPPELDGHEPKMKKLRTGMDSSSPIPPQHEVQGTPRGSELRKTYPLRCPKTQVLTITLWKALESDVDYKSSSNEKRKPRESATDPRSEGEEQAMAPLQTLFDKLPTDLVYMNKPHASFTPHVEVCGKKRGKEWNPQFLIALQTKRLKLKRFSDLQDLDYQQGKAYRIKDIEDIGTEWATVKEKGSEAEIQEFRDRKKRAADEIINHSTLCKAWERSQFILKAKQNREMREARQNDILTRLEALGYNSEDVRDRRVTGSHHFNSSTPVSEQDWRAIQHELESLVVEAEAERHRRERREMVLQRESLARYLIGGYCDTSDDASAFLLNPQDVLQTEPFRAIIELPNGVTVTADAFQSALGTLPDLAAARLREAIVDQRQALAENLLRIYQIAPNNVPTLRPRLSGFVKSEPFQAIIHLPNEVLVTAAEFQPALDTLPDLIAEAAKEIQSNLLQSITEGGATNIDSSLPEADLDRFQLATSTIFCKSQYNGLPFCGKDELSTHPCCEASTSAVQDHCLYYDRRASNAVAALLAAANMDPNTTVERMDVIDLRFYCPGWPKQSAPLALNWRDAVRMQKPKLDMAATANALSFHLKASHARTSDKLQMSSWKVFSPEETATIKAKEMANTGDRRYRFQCNACTPTGWIRRQDLESHLKFQ
ncbi:hypothetical protein FRC00_000286 [Tulasnella sp. 408]|nr:hypothetical protein FRC00_000286 [Tulasnella sp. 408]